MNSTNPSFVKRTLFILIAVILIGIPVFATWASSLTQEDADLWKMWIKLAIDGYGEPMPMNPLGEKPWWKFWD